MSATMLGHSLVLAGLGLHDAVFINDLDKFEVVCFAQSPVVVVVTGGHLEGACTKLPIHVLVGYNGDFSVENRYKGCLAHEACVAIVFWMNAYGCVTRNCFRTSGSHYNAFVAVLDMVADLPQMSLFVAVLHFIVCQGRMAARAPVDNVFAAVDKTFVIELHKDLAHSL